MNEKKTYKLEKEIEFWSKHLELDKFNYDKAVSNLVANMTVIISAFIGFLAILTSIEEIKGGLRNSIIIAVSIVVVIYSLKVIKDYKGQIKGHRDNFLVRDEHLRRMYKKLADVDKDKLNQEFREIKEDYKKGKIKLPYQK